MTRTKVSSYRQFAIYDDGGRLYAEAAWEDGRHVTLGSLATVTEEDLQEMVDEWWAKEETNA